MNKKLEIFADEKIAKLHTIVIRVDCSHSFSSRRKNKRAKDVNGIPSL